MEAITKSSSSNLTTRREEEVREGEVQKVWFRGDRFFRAADSWYFTIREKRDVGPFSSREDAEKGLTVFIECVCKQNMSIDVAIKTAQGGTWSITGFQ